MSIMCLSVWLSVLLYWYICLKSDFCPAICPYVCLSLCNIALVTGGSAGKQFTMKKKIGENHKDLINVQLSDKYIHDLLWESRCSFPDLIAETNVSFQESTDSISMQTYHPTSLLLLIHHFFVNFYMTKL